jgi:hypothetical protein
LNTIKPDFAILLEAGRSSQGHNFTQMAGEIEAETGLQFVCCYRTNPTELSFAKSLFVNPATIIPLEVTRKWTRGDGTICDGEYFGNDILIAKLAPVQARKHVYDKLLIVAATHFPMDTDARLRVAQWLADASHTFDHLVGDMNVFIDRRGQDQLDILESQFISTLPADTVSTYRDFDHNVKIGPNACIPVAATVIGPGDEPGTSKFIFEGWLDRAYQSKHSSISARSVVGTLTHASDHAPIITTYTL